MKIILTIFAIVIILGYIYYPNLDAAIKKLSEDPEGSLLESEDQLDPLFNPVNLRCAEPQIYGNVPLKIIRSAKIKCGFFYPRSPCVKYIRQVNGPLNYRVMCKGEETVGMGVSNDFSKRG